ncbi:LacI family DNA-binding transcriptional regulator [Deinococcus cellulosilyticus]|uniref:Transcriptional regulator n=1 Tax=Deinococcus cellulosilyticus (strain DSM 18568 / NBRC 106333 / KACC 11606 / 5516J-15) TaxID=1223518 RepID=A0A511MYL4_DEIC1|nr:LacI family DNA-binding transcriptional regulator [Deinococcus cellulosilyticus]GEM45685.1 transcriptional regulator [Deinococcus cellulosilyticus NBRC 106333 = KACC 11606]
MKPNVKQVARLAGVGTSTVSRVLNNHPNISHDAREKVMKAIEALGYTPNLDARSLRYGQTGAVSILLPVTGIPFYDTLLSGIYSELEKVDLDLAFFPVVGENRLRRYREATSIPYRADGLLIASLNPERMYQGRPPFSKPIVLVDTHHRDYHSVSFDNLSAGQMAAQHALECRLPIVFVDIQETPGEFESPVFGDRRRGIFSVLSRHGIVPRQTFYTTATLEGGRKIGQQLLQTPLDGPHFILAQCDDVAIGILRHLTDAGQQVGEDFLIMGFDDNQDAQQAGLTTIHQPVREMGEKAAGLLIQALAQELHQLQHQQLAPSLQVRQTTRT